MGQIVHGCAKTTEALRRTIQNSKESIAKLAERYDLNPKTIVFSKMNDKFPLWYYQSKVESLYIYTLEV